MTKPISLYLGIYLIKYSIYCLKYSLYRHVE